jgi:hypothetical protein
MDSGGEHDQSPVAEVDRDAFALPDPVAVRVPRKAARFAPEFGMRDARSI